MKRNYFNLHSLRRACLTGALVLTAMVASAQSTVIKGNVKDATGEPVIGATVKIQGETKTGSITDIDGNYEITVPSPKAKIEISYLGSKTQVVSVEGKTTVNVTLQNESQAIDEGVVTAAILPQRWAATSSSSPVTPTSATPSQARSPVCR